MQPSWSPNFIKKPLLDLKREMEHNTRRIRVLNIPPSPEKWPSKQKKSRKAKKLMTPCKKWS
jgi:hypothetical protein